MKSKIDSVLDIDRLPTLPAVALEAIRLMEEVDSATFDSIADLIKNDQVLVSKILRYANSAGVGSRKKITTISQAIAAIGFSALKAITLSVAIFDTFPENFFQHRDRLTNFWLHSIGVAATAEALARDLGFPCPSEAYASGLLHDLGKLACYLENPDGFLQLCQELELQGIYSTQGPSPLELEDTILGITHVEAGRIMGRHYGLPESLSRAMWLHHQPVVERIFPDKTQIPQLIRFADTLCVCYHIGSSYFFLSQPVSHDSYHFSLEKLMQLHDFDEEKIDNLMSNANKKVEKVSKVLGCWDEEHYQRLNNSAKRGLGRANLDLDRNNRQLAESHKVLAASSSIHKEVHSGFDLHGAARVVVDAVCSGFDISRCLCLIRDFKNDRYVGVSMDGSSCNEIDLPVNLEDLTSGYGSVNSGVEAEAINKLSEVSHDLIHEKINDTKLINMFSGSQVMASFFTAGSQSSWRKGSVLGELVADFSTGADFMSLPISELASNFQTMASAAGLAIERLLIEQDLTIQSEQLAEKSRKVEESQRQIFHSHRLATVGNLAAGAAHRINNPLTVISLNLQIMKRLVNEGISPEDVLKRLEVIEEQEDRISGVIQHIMDFSRPSEPEFSTVGVSELVNRALSIVSTQESWAEIKVDNKIPGDLPPVLVDEKQMEQVFTSLFLNAGQAMAGKGNLTLGANADEKFVTVSVTDDGEGIAQGDMGKIFDPFFTTRKEGEGAGLGLAIANSIVELNKGSILARSERGKGTTFLVSLPCDKSTKLQEMKSVLKSRAAEDVESPDKDRGQQRLLVIDDEEILNNILQETLDNAGYFVDGAYDGLEGIAKLRYRRYDLVLLDVKMPRKDGLDVLQFIKREYPDIKVIIITGLASLPEIKKTKKMGAYACLKKPFQLDKVLQTIQEALGA